MNNNELKEIDNKFVFDCDEANFVDRVIEASESKIVLVDFWAPWCGPCKQLSPLLEEIINDCKGKVVLAKINIDDNKQLGAQLRIQSIPTVVGFKDKKIVDGFQGLLPKKKLVEFIEKILGEKILEDHTNFYNETKKLISDNLIDQAKKVLEEHIAINSNDTSAISLYLECLIKNKEINEAKDFISGLTDEILKDSNIKSVLTKLEINEKNIKGPDLEALKKEYSKNSKKIENLINLSEKYFAENLINDAFELLLDNFLKFKAKEQAQIKKTLISFFSALGNENEQTVFYRKKYSSILFS